MDNVQLYIKAIKDLTKQITLMDKTFVNKKFFTRYKDIIINLYGE